MGGVDAIVFTAGLGENSPFMRDKICNGLEYLGTRIDPDLNQVRGKEREISVRRARVKFLLSRQTRNWLLPAIHITSAAESLSCRHLHEVIVTDNSFYPYKAFLLDKER